MATGTGARALSADKFIEELEQIPTVFLDGRSPYPREADRGKVRTKEQIAEGGGDVTKGAPTRCAHARASVFPVVVFSAQGSTSTALMRRT